jgi:hypothetical protein
MTMHHRLSTAFAAVLALLAASAFCAPAQAQTMYRCGKTYQDRPCDNGQQGKVIGNSEAPRATGKSVLDASCARRGDDAQKIVWSREAGALQDQLQSMARSGAQRKLIADVYAIRGTSSAVRAAIETDCVQEKEKSALAAAMLANAGIAPSVSSVPSVSSNDTSRKSDDGAAEAARRADNAARGNQASARKRALCSDLKAQSDRNRGSQRSAGNVGDMERLNQQRRETDGALSAAGCDDRSTQMQ